MDHIENERMRGHTYIYRYTDSKVISKTSYLNLEGYTQVNGKVISSASYG
jgi:hypothetical protein